ncbi:glycosyl transferase [Geomonas sp. Red276]
MNHDIRMAIVRPTGHVLSQGFYNVQEIGLARGLSRCGVSVDVFVAGRGAVSCQPVEAPGSGEIRLFQVPFITVPQIDHALYPQLPDLLRRGEYRLIQVNEENELTSYLVARYGQRHGIPVVVYQGMYQQLTGRIRAAFQRCYDRVLLPSLRDALSLALAKTNRAREHMEGKGFGNVQVIPVGLDPTPFQQGTERDWKAELSISEAHAIVLYVGVFERRRNVDFLLDVAKQLTGEAVTVVMAGDGPEFDRISRRTAAERIGNVRVVGKIPQQSLPSLYRQSSLFLLPSNYEIYGMVVLEAMYFGVPVLSTPTAGPRDVIESGVDGMLLDGLDEEAWGASIRELLAKNALRLGMAEAAQRKVRESLTWDAVAREYCRKVIEPVLGSSRQAP